MWASHFQSRCWFLCGKRSGPGWLGIANRAAQLPPGGYCVQPPACWKPHGCQEMPKPALGAAVDGQIWVLVQLGNEHCRMASNGTQLIGLAKEGNNWVCWGERTTVLCREWVRRSCILLGRKQMFVVLLSLNENNMSFIVWEALLQ